MFCNIQVSGCTVLYSTEAPTIAEKSPIAAI